MLKFHPKEWNEFCSLSADPSGTKSAREQKCIGEKGANLYSYRLIASRLRSAGILSDEKRRTIGNRDYMEFQLNVPQEALFLYEKAGKTSYSEPQYYFSDVTIGSNGIYSAKRGYDLCTGLGAPVGDMLIKG